MKTQILFASITLVFLFPSVALAGPIIRSGDSVSVEADQILEGDFYGLGSTVQISGTAEHDVYVAGGTVTINAPVSQDLVVLGGTVQIHGTVADDLRIVGGDVVIAESVSGDVVVVGGVVKILSTASVEGDVLLLAGEVEISGNVKGSVLGMTDSIRIDSSIGGDVSVNVSGTLALGDRAEILGNLEYESRHELARAQGAVVVGDITRQTPTIDTGAGATAALMTLLILLFAALTGYLLFKAPLEQLVLRTLASYGIQGLIGLAVLLGVPFVGFVLLLSVLGSIVGAAVLLLYVALLVVTWVASGIVLGSVILKPLMKTTKISLVTVVVGVTAFLFLALIPFIGPLLLFAVFLITLGGISTRIYSYFK